MNLVVVAVALVGLVVGSLLGFSVWTAHRVEKAVPPAGTFIDVDGNRIHYVDRGNGPAIVMIHGLGGQLRNFAFLPLAELEKSYRIILVDRPGSGYSFCRPDASTGINEQARIIARLIRVLGIERALLVGHSLGGAIALAVALNHPDTVSGLALICPLTHTERNVPKPFRLLLVRSSLLRRAISVTIAIPLAMYRSRATLESIFVCLSQCHGTSLSAVAGY